MIVFDIKFPNLPLIFRLERKKKKKTVFWLFITNVKTRRPFYIIGEIQSFQSSMTDISIFRSIIIWTCFTGMVVRDHTTIHSSISVVKKTSWVLPHKIVWAHTFRFPVSLLSAWGKSIHSDNFADNSPSSFRPFAGRVHFFWEYQIIVRENTGSNVCGVSCVCHYFWGDWNNTVPFYFIIDGNGRKIVSLPISNEKVSFMLTNS